MVKLTRVDEAVFNGYRKSLPDEWRHEYKWEGVTHIQWVTTYRKYLIAQAIYPDNKEPLYYVDEGFIITLRVVERGH